MESSGYSVDREHDLSERLALLARFVRGARFTNRHPAIDDGAKVSLLDERDDAKEIALPTHRRSEHLHLTKENLAQVEVGLEPRGRSARDDASTPRGREDALHEHVASDVLDHRIDAAFVRE